MITRVSRRRFLSGAAAATLLARAGVAQDGEPTTPEAALSRLMQGNQRFAADQLTSIAGDLKLLKEHTVDKQEPFAAVLSCADSRVPVELVFDQTIGHIFVARVAGNIINSEIIGSLEYGAESGGHDPEERAVTGGPAGNDLHGAGAPCQAGQTPDPCGLL